MTYGFSRMSEGYNISQQLFLPQTGDRVGIEGRITADDRSLLDHRLGDQQVVERVTVMERQRR
jgi:hypothetical protein